MKKITCYLITAAAILSSCVKEQENNIVSSASDKLHTISFTAATPETKTSFGEPSDKNYPVLWNAEDIIGITYTNFDGMKETEVIPSSDGKAAEFRLTVSENDWNNGNKYFIAINPAASWKSFSKTNKTTLVEFPSGQVSATNSPDPMAQIICGKTEESESVPQKVLLSFNHVSAYLHLSFSNADLGDASVKGVDITTTPNITGRFQYNFDSSNTSANTDVSVTNSVFVKTNSLDNIWCGIAPGSMSGDACFKIITDKGTLKKTINIPNDDKYNLASGKIAKISIDMSGASMAAPVLYTKVTSADQLSDGAKVIIVAKDDDIALCRTQNTNNRGETLVLKEGSLVRDPGNSVEEIELSKNEDGTFYLKATKNDGYLYYVSGGNNLRTKAAAGDDCKWDISIEDGKSVIKAKSNETYSLRYNKAANLFSAYTSSTTSAKDVCIYVKQTSFPVVWSFPAASAFWKSPDDFNMNKTSGSYVYSDNHQGILTAVRPFGNEVSIATYQATNDISSYTGVRFLHYNMFKDAYWQFDVTNVHNPAGTYNIEYAMCASSGGPKYFILEYYNGTSWEAFGTPTASDAKDYNGTDTYSYSYKLDSNNSPKKVSVSGSLPAIDGTLSIRARVVTTMRVSSAGEITSTGTNRILNNGSDKPIVISFTPEGN